MESPFRLCACIGTMNRCEAPRLQKDCRRFSLSHRMGEGRGEGSGFGSWRALFPLCDLYVLSWQNLAKASHSPRHFSDYTQFLAHFSQLLKSEIDLLLRMGCHEANANQFVPGQHSWGNDRIDEDPFFLQSFAEFERWHHASNINRHDRGL